MPAATPFQSPRWLLPWWRQFGTGMPRVAVARRGGTLAGMLPLYVLTKPASASCCRSAPAPPTISTRSATRRRCSPPRSPALADDPVDGCDLIEVPPGSALRGQRRRRAGGRSGPESSPCPVLSLSAHPVRHPPQAAHEPAPRRARRRLDDRDRRAGNAAGHAWPSWSGCTRRAGPRRASRACSPARPCSRSSARPRPACSKPGCCGCKCCAIAGAIAAAILALLAPGRIFFYLSGFDEAHAFVSPGTLLSARCWSRRAPKAARRRISCAGASLQIRLGRGGPVQPVRAAGSGAMKPGSRVVLRSSQAGTGRPWSAGTPDRTVSTDSACRSRTEQSRWYGPAQGDVRAGSHQPH